MGTQYNTIAQIAEKYFTTVNTVAAIIRKYKILSDNDAAMVAHGRTHLDIAPNGKVYKYYKVEDVRKHLRLTYDEWERIHDRHKMSDGIHS